jgi:hypothetical protein
MTVTKSKRDAKILLEDIERERGRGVRSDLEVLSSRELSAFITLFSLFTYTRGSPI